MRNLFFTISFVFFLFPQAQANDITGKWYCSGTFFDSLGVSIYPKIKGYYKFEKDGTFTVRISGEMQSAQSSSYFDTGAWKDRDSIHYGPKYQTLLINVEGSYSINGNTITTDVDSNDVYVYINTGQDNIPPPNAWMSRSKSFTVNLIRNSTENIETHADLHKKTIIREKMRTWRWKDMPLTVTKDYMQVGEDFVFYKSRRKAAKTVSAKRKSKYYNVDFMARYRAGKIIHNRKSSAGNRQWAVRTLEKAAVKDSSSLAMYDLGFAYKEGIGVTKDSAKAVMWLEKSARAGHETAYHTLGLMYKYGEGGVRQNFEKAYEYFSKGAEKEDRPCMYSKGYMLYKGLGCKQNYQEAAMSFLPVANSAYITAKNYNASSWYMLGLCSRNGYGLVKDSAAAVFCLKRAAKRGWRDARTELAYPHEETYLSESYLYDDEYSHIPDCMPDIKPDTVGCSLIAGNYQGFVVTYDWSGKYILEEKPLAMSVNSMGNALSGVLTIGTDKVSYSGELSDGRLQFKDGGLTLPERYMRKEKMLYRLDSMTLDADSDKICGRLSIYSQELKEPGRPMYFELRQNNISAATGNGK